MARPSLPMILALALVALGAAQGRLLRAACDPSKCVSQASTFWHSTTITDPKLACDAIENSCCPACAKVWAPYVEPNYQTSKAEFVYSGNGHGTAAASGPPDLKAHDHVIVMPNKPCRGVEDWHEAHTCHYEYVWDAAWAAITAAGGDAPRKKAMAINSQHYRTQHQMHVHVADIQRGMGDWLQSLKPDGSTVYSADCKANGVVNALKCSSVTSGGNAQAVCAPVKTGMPPNDVHPFETAYTNSYDATTMQRRGTLVYSPAADVFCVVTVEDRPVECLLYCATDCAGKVGSGCP